MCSIDKNENYFGKYDISITSKMSTTTLDCSKLNKILIEALDKMENENEY